MSLPLLYTDAYAEIEGQKRASMATYATSLGQFISQLRYDHHLSLRAFGKSIDLDPRSVRKLETDTFPVTAQQLRTIACVYKVSLTLLYAYLAVGATNGAAPSRKKLAATQRGIERHMRDIAQRRRKARC